MNKDFICDLNFDNLDFIEKPLKKGDYDNCTFSNCNFSNSDLSKINFLECEFIHCDISNAIIKSTIFREIIFKDCKLLGLHFNECDDFLLSFEFNNCTLNFSSFYHLNLKNTIFNDCKIQEVDFVETNLSNSQFINCDMERTIFDNTNLESVDFHSAYNFTIDIDLNRINKAKFSKEGLVGLLYKYNLEIN